MTQTWTWSIAALCWLLVTATWIAGAVHATRHAPRRRARARSGLAPLLLVVFPLAWGANELLPSGQVRLAEWLTVVASAVLPVCTAFTVWARVALGTMWTPMPSVRVGHELRTDGPYAVTRHPIYTGVLGMFLCTALISQHGWAFAVFVVVAVALRMKVRAEERMLGEVFGQAYDAYRARVPGLVPLGWLRRTR